jgi:dTMP kinase
MSGKFITIEGIEGVGKSSNVDFVCQCIRDAGHDVMKTREPGGTPGAERIRQLLLDAGGEHVPDQAELLLMFAARALHLENRIKPALDKDIWVVCDRFTDASYAYQGGGRGMDHKEIAALEKVVQDGLQPDLTLLLDAPISIALARAKKRNCGNDDRFEREREEFFERVRSVYLARAAEDKGRVVVVDATGNLEQVQTEIQQILQNRFEVNSL